MTDLLVEKYRPQKLSDLIVDENTKKKFNQFIEDKDIPHLLFYGSAGIGKSTTAKIFAKTISPHDYLYINASDEASVDTIRTKVKDFCSTVSIAGELKIVILDEVDGISDHAMRMLRNTMEQFSSSCRFILTCNYITKIPEPIRSRCQEFNFTEAPPAEIAKRCLKILKEEGIDCDDCKKQITTLVKTFYPDIRKVINALQQYTVDGTFNFVEGGVANRDDKKRLLELLNSCDIKTIRKELCSMGADYVGFYRALFDNAKRISEDNAIEIMLHVSEYQYRHAIVPDQEINFVACLLQICNSK